MTLIIRPTPVESMKQGDLFRSSGRTLQIADIEKGGGIFVITYYTGTSTLVNSFFLSPEDTLDLVLGEN